MSGSLKIGIAGLGTVGKGVIDLLSDNKGLISNRVGKCIDIYGVSATDRSKNRGIELHNFEWFDNAIDLASSPQIDVFVELVGGNEGIAKESVEAALKSGKNVVTANKALIAEHGLALSKIAIENSSSIFYEASVAGGIPIIKTLKESLAGNKISKIYGILNGTSNFILTKMEQTGKSFDVVLKEAQNLGYAESDPSFDVNGKDTAHKLAILTSLMIDVPPNLSSIEVEGIDKISSVDISYAKKLGFCIKLLGMVLKTEKGYVQRVNPCMIPTDSSISRVNDAKNAVFVEGNFIGSLILEGLGAGAGPTASAVVSDIIDIARDNLTPMSWCNNSNNVELIVDRERIGPWYLRLEVIDQPGVLAEISAELKNQSVSIESVLQRGRAPGECVSLIITTHETNENKFKKAMENIKCLDSLTEPPCIIRIENL